MSEGLKQPTPKDLDTWIRWLDKVPMEKLLDDRHGEGQWHIDDVGWTLAEYIRKDMGETT